ncbi:MAG TPA: hypothetical protein VIX17_11495 [Pyrinomonadaceae bacterium]
MFYTDDDATGEVKTVAFIPAGKGLTFNDGVAQLPDILLITS